MSKARRRTHDEIVLRLDLTYSIYDLPAEVDREAMRRYIAEWIDRYEDGRGALCTEAFESLAPSAEAAAECALADAMLKAGHPNDGSAYTIARDTIRHMLGGRARLTVGVDGDLLEPMVCTHRKGNLIENGGEDYLSDACEACVKERGVALEVRAEIAAMFPKGAERDMIQSLDVDALIRRLHSGK